MTPAMEHTGKYKMRITSAVIIILSQKEEYNMLVDTSAAGVRRGKALWGAMPLPVNAQLLGTVRRAEEQGEEALILMPTGITVGGGAGTIKPLPPLMLHCLRCNYDWPMRGEKPPRNCPGCNSPYWDKLRIKKI